MKWMIVTDSSSDLISLDTGTADIGFDTVPFVMNIDQKDYVDNSDLSVPTLVDAMEASRESHSACPSPAAWYEVFRRADRVIALTISGRLSGSFNSAMAGRLMTLENHPGKKIEVVDSLATGPKLALLARHAVKMIQDQVPMETVCDSCRKLARSVRTVFTLSSFHNLVQNGRVGRIAGFLADRLDIRAIGVGSPEGEIQMKELLRGEKRVIKKILKDMEENGYNGAEMAISHCLNESMAHALKQMILSRWENAKILILPTRGLDSYYAERSGLIVSFPMVSAPGSCMT